MNQQTPSQRLKWARQQHGLYDTPTDAAKAFGWTVSTYLGHENGDRNPSRAAAKRYGRAYRVRWEWLLEGEGSPTPGKPSVRLIGAVGVGASVALYDIPKILEASETPPGALATTSAIAVEGNSMRGIADDGWLIFFDHEQRPPGPGLIGKLCVLQLKSGDILIRTLQPGRKKAHYDLESPAEQTLRDQKVVWAAPVTWIKPR